ANDAAKALRMATHQTLAEVSSAIERLRFNTAIARLYSFLGTLHEVVDHPQKPFANDPAHAAATREAFDIMVQMIAPMMPHLAEECWDALGHPGLVSEAGWPAIEDSLLVSDTVTIPVQINGKKKADVTV